MSLARDSFWTVTEVPNTSIMVEREWGEGCRVGHRGQEDTVFPFWIVSLQIRKASLLTTFCFLDFSVC